MYVTESQRNGSAKKICVVETERKWHSGGHLFVSKVRCWQWRCVKTNGKCQHAHYRRKIKHNKTVWSTRADYAHQRMWPFPLSLILHCVLNRGIDYKLRLVLLELCISPSYQYRSRSHSIIHIMFESMEPGPFPLIYSPPLSLRCYTHSGTVSHYVRVKTLTDFNAETERQLRGEVCHNGQWGK